MLSLHVNARREIGEVETAVRRMEWTMELQPPERSDQWVKQADMTAETHLPHLSGFSGRVMRLKRFRDRRRRSHRNKRNGA